LKIAESKKEKDSLIDSIVEPERCAYAIKEESERYAYAIKEESAI